MDGGRRGPGRYNSYDRFPSRKSHGRKSSSNKKRYWERPEAKAWRLKSLGEFLQDSRCSLTPEELLHIYSNGRLVDIDVDYAMKVQCRALYDEWFKTHRAEIDLWRDTPEGPVGWRSPDVPEADIGTPQASMMVLGGHQTWEEICSGDGLDLQTGGVSGLPVAPIAGLTMGRGLTVEGVGSSAVSGDGYPGHVGMGMHSMAAGPDSSGLEPAATTKEPTPPAKPARRLGPPDLDQDTVRWTDGDAGNLGHFFVNKIYLDEDKTRHWQPEDLQRSQLEVLSWEDLVPLDDLDMALLVYPESWPDVEKWLAKFNASTMVTIVCKGKPTPEPYRKKRDHRERAQPTPTWEWICPNHVGEGATCQCVSRRQIQIIHPHRSEYIRCNLLVLRYSTHLRFAVLSGSMKPSLWQHTLQFNWYADFPIDERVPNIECRKAAMFEMDLKMTLEALGAGSRIWIKQVDFSGLSPFISLLLSHAETLKSRRAPYYALPKLQWKTKIVKYPEDQVESITLTTYVGDTEALQQLNQVFKVPAGNPLNSKVKLVYPNQSHVDRQVATSDLQLSDLPSTLIKFKDMHRRSSPNLHDLPEDFPLHLGNAYVHSVLCGDGRRLGWLAVGSHAVNPFSWGRHSRLGSEVWVELRRYDVSVLCAPYRDSGSGPACLERYEEEELHCGDLYALDLAPFWLPSLPVAPYPEHAAPFIPLSDEPSAKDTDKAGHSIGEIVRLKDSFCFVAAPPEGHPAYSKFAPFSSTGLREAFLHQDVWMTCHMSLRMAPRVVVEVTIIELQGKLRISKVHNAYHGWHEALTSNGIDTALLQPSSLRQQPSQDWSSMVAAEQSSLKAPVERPIEDLLKDCGITDDAEFDEYWMNQFRPGASKVRQNLRNLANTDIEKEYPLTPWTSNLSDMSWLEKHVERRCGGRLPKLIGPYDVNYVTKQFLGVRLEMMPDMMWPKNLDS